MPSSWKLRFLDGLQDVNAFLDAIKRAFDPKLHPRDPRTGRFVRKGTGTTTVGASAPAESAAPAKPATAKASASQQQTGGASKAAQPEGAKHPLDFKGAFTLGKNGATSDLRDKMWAAFKAGHDRPVGNVRDPLVTKALRELPEDATREEFEEFINYGGAVPTWGRKRSSTEARQASGAAQASKLSGEHVLSAIKRIQPRAENGVPVKMEDLRKVLGGTREEQDKAISELARHGALDLHTHPWPAKMTEKEKKAAIPDGKGGYFNGVAVRQGVNLPKAAAANPQPLTPAHIPHEETPAYLKGSINGQDFERKRAKIEPAMGVMKAALERAKNLPAEQRILAAAWAAAGNASNDSARIADIAEQLPDMSIEQIHQKLKEMQQDGSLILYPNDNRQELTERDHKAAIKLGGLSERHLVYVGGGSGEDKGKAEAAQRAAVEAVQKAAGITAPIASNTSAAAKPRAAQSAPATQKQNPEALAAEKPTEQAKKPMDPHYGAAMTHLIHVMQADPATRVTMGRDVGVGHDFTNPAAPKKSTEYLTNFTKAMMDLSGGSGSKQIPLSALRNRVGGTDQEFRSFLEHNVKSGRLRLQNDGSGQTVALKDVDWNKGLAHPQPQAPAQPPRSAAPASPAAPAQTQRKGGGKGKQGKSKKGNGKTSEGSIHVASGHYPPMFQKFLEWLASKSLDSADHYYVADDMGYYAPLTIGRTRKMTPEGFLICEGVPIARTGVQYYRKEDFERDGKPCDLETDGMGRIVVHRLPEDVFDPTTIASFNGKPLTVEHPPDFVNPETWRQMTIGTVVNPRRGTGDQSDLLLADLLVTAADGIHFINTHLPELSCGYNAKYVPIVGRRGEYAQREIIGNHVAAVRRGRAGNRVSVKDHQEDPDMNRSVRQTVSAVLSACGIDPASIGLVSRALDTVDGGTYDAPDDPDKDARLDEEILHELRTMKEGMRAMGDALREVYDWKKGKEDEEDEEEEEERRRAEDAARRHESEEEEKRRKRQEEEAEEEEVGDTVLEAEGPGMTINLGHLWTGDSASDPYQEVKARIEILSPGFDLPTKDALKGTHGKKLAACMRRALVTACTRDSMMRERLKPFLVTMDTDGSIQEMGIEDLKGPQLAGVFRYASDMIRDRNNQASRLGAMRKPTQDRAYVTPQHFGRIVSPSEINEINRKYREEKKAKMASLLQ